MQKIAQKTLVTRASLMQLLANDKIRDKVIGRALVGLLRRQTDAESQTNTTQAHNLRGFMPCDAKQGSISAKTFIKRGELLEFQVKHWMEPTKQGYPRICKYVRQLNEIANEKAR